MGRMKRKKRMMEHFEEALKNVEIIVTTIENLELKRDVIAEKHIVDSLETKYYDLEIALALCGIIIRKLDENSFIKISGSFRRDINGLIHSNNIQYLKDTNEIIVYSSKESRQINIEAFIVESHQIFNNLLIK